jgi:GSH-dependent disulfide-bond oxidoreductase
MFDLYTFGTPNGHKASIMLEELGLPYELHVVDIRKGDQHTPEFLAVNPNGKIPAIVDHDAAGGPLAVFESGAILIYLAEKTGKLLAPAGKARYEALEWVMFQMGGVGPMFGQYNHFASAAPEKLPYAIERYAKESLRLLAVLDGRLADHDYLAGDYSIADVCTYPWVAAVLERIPGAADQAHVKAWVDRVGARPAVQKGMKIP